MKKKTKIVDWSTLPLSEYNIDWDRRTKNIAELIPPGSSVIEFGAGRCVLRDHIPDNCTYTPSDIVSRGEDTLVCDLNKNLPELKLQYDIAVFGGVLEYINDVPRLISHLYNYVEILIVGYMFYNHGPLPKNTGFVNAYTKNKLSDLFNKIGYNIVYKNGNIFKFKRIDNERMDR